MCKIYLAESEHAGTLVVLKVFSQVPDVSERFVGFDGSCRNMKSSRASITETSCRFTIRRRGRSCVYRHGAFPRG